MIIKAVIFDLNGTILDDEDEYGKAFKKVLKRLDVKIKGEYPHTTGIGVEENWKRFLKELKIKTEKSVEELTLETQKEYLKLLTDVNVKSGFRDFAKNLKKEGIKIALATSNTWMVTEKVMDKFSLEDIFDVVTTSEELTFNKPDPQIFELTAQKLDVDPWECVVFEDSEAGITAAHLAGMKAIGVAREDGQSTKDADSVIGSYGELTRKKSQEIL